MIYVKSTLIGFVCWLATTIVYAASLTYILMRRYPPPSGIEVGFDLRMLVYRPSYWLIALTAFAAGFYWSFRR